MKKTSNNDKGSISMVDGRDGNMIWGVISTTNLCMIKKMVMMSNPVYNHVVSFFEGFIIVIQVLGI